MIQSAYMKLRRSPGGKEREWLIPRGHGLVPRKEEELEVWRESTMLGTRAARDTVLTRAMVASKHNLFPSFSTWFWNMTPLIGERVGVRVVKRIRVDITIWLGGGRARGQSHGECVVEAGI